MSDMIINPLVNAQQLVSTDTFNDIKTQYTNLYLLAYNNKNPIDEAIYAYNIDKFIFNTISEDLVLIKAPMTLLKNYTHFINTNILSQHTIEIYNIYNYELDEKNLVLIILNMTYENVKIYLTQFNITTFDDIYKMVTLNQYFNNEIIIKQKILNFIESEYWTRQYNCSKTLNLTYLFKKRKLNFYNKETNKIIENYTTDINKNTNYVDPSSIIINNNYRVTNNCIFTKEDIAELLINFPMKEKYLLFCNLLISKKYCHLVLNNMKVLIHMKNIINDNINLHLFRYLIGYAWVRLYLDESITKTFTTKNSQFIFDINTASELPVFPFSIKYPKSNPYMPIMVDDKILNSENNIGGVEMYKTGITNYIYDNGIANLDTFKKNLNIFCTGNPVINIFEGIEWTRDKIALGGSVMCACIQKLHPLVNQFNNFNENERLKRYFNEYYTKSDIDVMFLTDNQIDFINKVNIFYKQICINICKNNSDADPQYIKLVCNKHVYLFITDENINTILLKHSNITKDFIINTINDDTTILLFIDIFNSEIEKYKTIFFNKLTQEEIENYKINQPNYIDFDNLIFKIRLAKQNKNDKIYNDKLNISISFKYKITSPYLDYPFELFSVKYDDFFATVQTFHLPCVRAYYNGENVYLTPSCITAHLTYMNIDYKYFVGSQSSCEILNKYRMRGFGVWLNNNEKDILFKYIQSIPFWNNLYNIESLVEHLPTGSLDINHKVFQPRLYNTEYFYENTPVDIIKGYYIYTELENYVIKTKTDYNNAIPRRSEPQLLQNKDELCINIMSNLNTISSNGVINPIKKWVIETIWNIYND